MSITHVFFDVGGVLGTNGWDQHQRAAAAEAFGLDVAELHKRHEEAVTVWETGGMSLDEYLDHTVFHRARPFSREEFRTFMLSQSVAFPETIAVARDLARTGRYRMMTINNESAEAEPSAVAFIDDREHNLEPARGLGMHTILYHDAPQLRRDLTALAVAI